MIQYLVICHGNPVIRDWFSSAGLDSVVSGQDMVQSVGQYLLVKVIENLEPKLTRGEWALVCR
jgi:hypothetical protein